MTVYISNIERAKSLTIIDVFLNSDLEVLRMTAGEIFPVLASYSRKTALFTRQEITTFLLVTPPHRVSYGFLPPG